ncbi:MAG: hypothetical protein RLZZ221_2032 [Verrucomicrobiota bacterium]|jgi:hypothetical protein
MPDDKRPAVTPRATTTLAPLPNGSALIDEIAAILGAGIARVVEANAMRRLAPPVHPEAHMELAIKRESRLTVRSVEGNPCDGDEGESP